LRSLDDPHSLRTPDALPIPDAGPPRGGFGCEVTRILKCLIAPADDQILERADFASRIRQIDSRVEIGALGGVHGFRVPVIALWLLHDAYEVG
jgi:hypothetical protein